MSLGIRGGDEVVIVGFEPAAAAGIAAIARAIRNLETVAPHAGSGRPWRPRQERRTPRICAASSPIRACASDRRSFCRRPICRSSRSGRGMTQRNARVRSRARRGARAALAARDHRGADGSRNHVARTSSCSTTPISSMPRARPSPTARARVSRGGRACAPARDQLTRHRRCAPRRARRRSAATSKGRCCSRSMDRRRRTSRFRRAASCSRATSRPRSSSISTRGSSPASRSRRGGPTSHVAILAATLGIPMLVAMGQRLLEIARRQHRSSSMPTRAR